jgi:transposase
MAMKEMSMSKVQYTDEFRAEAVKQVLDRGFSVVEVAARIGLPKHTLYDWVQRAKKAALTEVPRTAEKTESAEIRRLKAELRRVTEERDILKKAAAYFAKG